MNDTMPLVSVVVPAYNVRAFIGEALRSVQAQDYPALEIIVVDDGSQDGTADLVAREFPAVRLFRKDNGGSATARNLGLREARGEVVAFLDADDVWLPGKLSAQMAYLEAHPDVLMLGTGFTAWHPDADGVFRDPQEEVAALGAGGHADADAVDRGWAYHRLLLDNFVWTTTVVMRRALIRRIGFFDESLRLGQDYDYFLRASRETEIHVLQRVYAVYRQHPGSAIARGADFNYAAHIIRRAVDRWGLASPDGAAIAPAQLARRLYGIHFSCGYRHYRKRAYAQACEEFKAALRVHPAALRGWGYFFFALLKSR